MDLFLFFVFAQIKPIMYYPLSSCLILLFLLSLFYHLSYASSKQELGSCRSLFQCGNITAGFPFWGRNRDRVCGHPLLELHCNRNNSTSLTVSEQEYSIFNIDQTLYTLTLARTDFLGPFCSANFNKSILPDEMYDIFEFSQLAYQNLTVGLHCDPSYSYHAYYNCPVKGLVSVSMTLTDRNLLSFCNEFFAMPAPKSYIPEKKDLNLTHLESVLGKGFVLNLTIDKKPCQECSSAGDICSFYGTQQVCLKMQRQRTGVIDCDDEKRYYLTRNLSSTLLHSTSDNFSRNCSRNVSIPASGSALKTMLNTSTPYDLRAALAKGFELRFNLEYNQTQTSSGFICYCVDKLHNGTCVNRNKDGGLTTRAKADGGLSSRAEAEIGIASGIVAVFLIAGGLFCLISRQRKTSNEPRQQNLKALIPLKHYSYVQVKRITKSFAEVVGKGGFGTVYRGTLCDGRSVAVKILKDSKGSNGEEFINEVASISKTSHVNIVSLLGFCSEGSKRAIIYEYLENGSLDRFISSKTWINIDLMALYEIALGVARGLEYLHYGCKTRIVHFDIKPQNVLLDDNLCPKVSDFGLAKLCEKKESILSLIETRGTIGYIAPELFSTVYGRASHKSDVYSYGMLVLEMIGARKKERAAQNSASNASSMYFPEWIYKDLEKKDSGRLNEDGITCEGEDIAKKMTLVGLWCIQSFPADRPSMNRVVEMMEGSVGSLKIPPRPVFQIPAASLQETSTLSEDISYYTEACSINVS